MKSNKPLCCACDTAENIVTRSLKKIVSNFEITTKVFSTLLDECSSLIEMSFD